MRRPGRSHTPGDSRAGGGEDRPAYLPFVAGPGGGVRGLVVTGGGEGLVVAATPGAGLPCGWGLVEAARGGDREAFGRIYDQHAGVVFRFVLSRVWDDRVLAEDITSETFLRALRGLPAVEYRGRGIGAWLVTIARNVILDHRKSSRYRWDSPVAEVPESAVAVAGPEEVVVAREARAEVLRAVAGLGGAQRDCILLRFWVGLPVTETATAMNRTASAVKALQHRAVRRLARLLPQLDDRSRVTGRT